MNNRLNFLIIGITALFLAGFLVLAQQDDPFANISYPISELGNCENREGCETYCANPENSLDCLDYAEANNLIALEEIEIARRMLTLGETSGPGDCRGYIECESYCEIIDHIDECLDFAEGNDLIPPEELEEARKVAAAIEQGFEPPNCNSRTECDIYCSQPENIEECIVFAEAAGLIPPDELEEVKLYLDAVKRGIKPPNCQGPEECDIYCSLPENFEECMTFAEAAGFISPEEALMIRKTGGEGPGGCRGEECEVYCDDPTHAEECINFAIKHGFMSPEEAEEARKFLAADFTTGPGGCQGPTGCEAYCNDLAHTQECLEFAIQAGFMTQEEAERAKRVADLGIAGGPGGCQGGEECRAFCDDPQNIEECLDFGIRIGEITPEEAKRARYGAEGIRAGGPGGCKSELECKAYCDDPAHAEECVLFSIEQGFISQEEAQRILHPGGITPPPTEGFTPYEGFVPEEFLSPEGEIIPYPIEYETSSPQSFFFQFLKTFTPRYLEAGIMRILGI